MREPTARFRMDITDLVLLDTALSYYKQRPEAPEGEFDRMAAVTSAALRIEQAEGVPA